MSRGVVALARAGSTHARAPTASGSAAASRASKSLVSGKPSSAATRRWALVMSLRTWVPESPRSVSTWVIASVPTRA